MQNNNNFNTLIFAACLGLFCSLILVLVNLQTKPLRLANERAEELRNYLFALEVPVPVDAESDEMLVIFDKNIKVNKTGSLTIYEYYPDGESTDGPIAYAVPLSGSGLWGRIDGVLALEKDLLTIRAIRFFKQSETPGLGGEIGANWFQDQFSGKSILSADEIPGFTIVKPGEPNNNNSVDGISGATMTSERVEVILDNLISLVYLERSQYE